MRIDKYYRYFKILKTKVTQEMLDYSVNTNPLTVREDEGHTYCMLKFNVFKIPMSIVMEPDAAMLTHDQMIGEISSGWGE